MSDLLASVIKAHGGLERWNTFEKVSTTIVSGGELWATKGSRAIQHLVASPPLFTANGRA
jgi:hypothetical protein